MRLLSHAACQHMGVFRDGSLLATAEAPVLGLMVQQSGVLQVGCMS